MGQFASQLVCKSLRMVKYEQMCMIQCEPVCMQTSMFGKMRTGLHNQMGTSPLVIFEAVCKLMLT